MKGNKVIKYLLITVSLLFLFLFLIVPLVTVIVKSLREGFGVYLDSITDPYTLKALGLTILATVVAVVVNTLFGLCAAWAITRFQFPGKKWLNTLIALPVSVSPVIAGLAFVLMFGRKGFLYPLFEALHISVVYAVPGILIATIFVTFPFVYREIAPVLEAVGTTEEEAAASMGANAWTIFTRITFPHIKWSFIYGVVLCAARALGEFGAVSSISGHLRGITNTLPLQVEILFNEFHYTQAFAASSLLVIFAVIILIIKSIAENVMREK